MHDPKRAGVTDMNKREREPQLCFAELMQIIMQGFHPSQARLEYMLDNIEAMP